MKAAASDRETCSAGVVESGGPAGDFMIVPSTVPGSVATASLEGLAGDPVADGWTPLTRGVESGVVVRPTY